MLFKDQAAQHLLKHGLPEIQIAPRSPTGTGFRSSPMISTSGPHGTPEVPGGSSAQCGGGVEIGILKYNITQTQTQTRKVTYVLFPAHKNIYERPKQLQLIVHPYHSVIPYDVSIVACAKVALIRCAKDGSSAPAALAMKRTLLVAFDKDE